MPCCRRRDLLVLHGVMLLALAGLCAAAGCSRRLPTAAVQGKVLYQGQPLRFGSVLFQSAAGPPATGIIQPDGTFQLSTYGKNDGAVIGKHQVQITCYESQDPQARPAASEGESGRGRSLIPEKYSSYTTSGIQVEVTARNEPFEWDLK